MRNLIYKLYKMMDNNPLITTVVHYIYHIILPLMTGKNKSCKYDSKRISYKKSICDKKKSYKDIKIAIICDDMTYKSFKDECDIVFLTPSNWFETMEKFQPDIFLCESAWNGISDYKNCWRGKIYKNKNILFNNRKDLFNIIDYCKKSSIKTVFWNKEDPIYFDDLKNNFSDTALYFDYIFTTCAECVSKYKNLGHKNVYTLMFGFSEKIFNPINSNEKKNTAIFAGSWYSDFTERCQDMMKIFKMVEDNNIKLEIYDRNYNDSNPLKVFPEKFKDTIHPSIPFENLKSLYKNSSFAININTIKNSETMFARRVFELMACNTCVISNNSIGMEKMFDKNVWFLGKEFDFSSIKKICAENVQYVMENHTNAKRLKQIYDTIGINYVNLNNNLIVIYENCNLQKSKEHFMSLNYENKLLFVKRNNRFINIQNEDDIVDSEYFINNYKSDYFIIFKSNNYIPINIKKAIVHFNYLEESVAISNGSEKFIFKQSKDYYNCLLTSKVFEKIIMEQDYIITKYTI